jgi:hypothetical protein
VSIDTDAEQLSPRRMRELVELDREFRRKFEPLGSTKLIASLLAIMNILTASAIVGGIVMYGKVTSLSDKVDLIIQGRIKVP